MPRSHVSVEFFVKICFRLYEKRASPPWPALQILLTLITVISQNFEMQVQTLKSVHLLISKYRQAYLSVFRNQRTNTYSCLTNYYFSSIFLECNTVTRNNSDLFSPAVRNVKSRLRFKLNGKYFKNRKTEHLQDFWSYNKLFIDLACSVCTRDISCLCPLFCTDRGSLQRSLGLYTINVGPIFD